VETEGGNIDNIASKTTIPHLKNLRFLRIKPAVKQKFVLLSSYCYNNFESRGLSGGSRHEAGWGLT
jgi:hypothetical protein